jgi:hypothetical protein
MEVAVRGGESAVALLQDAVQKKRVTLAGLREQLR